jgi:flagellar hook-associated protein 3 FlgL
MTGISTLAQSLSQISRIQEQQSLLDTLGTQLATGRKTQVLSGLDTEVSAALRSRVSMSSLDTYINNIKIADRRTEYTLNTIEQFQQQAENFSAALVGFMQQGAHQDGEEVYYDDPLTPEIENDIIGYSSADPDIDLETLQDLASNLYDYMADLLNSKDGDRYVLNGATTESQPFTDSGTLDSAISTQLDAWRAETITTEELIADLQDRTIDDGNLDAFTDTVIGYSSTLSSGTAGSVVIRVDDRTEVDATVLANDQGFRDIMVALSFFKSADLGPIADQVEIDAVTGLPVVITEGAPGANVDEMTDNFYEVFNALSGMVNSALDDIDQQRFKLELARARIDEIKTDHEGQRALLQSTVDDIENADINDVAVKINALSTQLEASYSMTSFVQQLSLVNFI